MGKFNGNKRVNRPGRTSKEVYDVGEEVLIQDVKPKLWDRKGVVTEIRTTHNNKMVSYELDIGGHNGIGHRKYLRIIVPIDEVVDV